MHLFNGNVRKSKKCVDFSVIYKHTFALNTVILCDYDTFISSSSDSEKSECLLETEDGVKCKSESRMISWSPREWQKGARGLSPLRAASLSNFFATSLKSGLGFIFVGNVCSLHPPDESSSRSLELRHFILRFWNQIFTWGESVVSET